MIAIRQKIKIPLKKILIKSMDLSYRVEAVHVTDFEELNNAPAFKTTLDFMRQAESKTKNRVFELLP